MAALLASAAVAGKTPWIYAARPALVVANARDWGSSMDGGCTCGQLRYRLQGTPLIVHACHCRWCQRETGTAHALNALYEADRVIHIAGEPAMVDTPSASGGGQKVARCPACKVAIWSNYPQAGAAVRFLRVGTLDEPDRCPRTSISLPHRSNPGSFCHRARGPFRSFTISRWSGLRRAWSGGGSCASADGPSARARRDALRVLANGPRQLSAELTPARRLDNYCGSALGDT